MTIAESEFACPVCLRGNSHEPRCPGCGWVLSTGYELGVVTDADEHEFERNLVAAQRAVDLRAALLAAGYPAEGDQQWLDRTLAFVRGSPPATEDLDGIRSTLDNEPSGERSLVLAVVEAMNRLLVSDSAMLVVVELTADGVSWAKFERDDVSFVLRGRVRTSAWEELLPVLPADPVRQRFVLAGGIGTGPVPPEVLGPAVEALARKDFGSSEVDSEIVVACRVAGWAIPERLVSSLPGRHRNVRVLALSRIPRSLGDEGVADLLNHAPLCRDLAVVVADVDVRGGPVRPWLRTIYPAGTSAAVASEVNVRVSAPAVARTPMAVVVATGTGNIPAAWRARSVTQVEARPGDEHLLRFGLRAGASVTMECGSVKEIESVGDVAARWNTIAMSIPDHYEPATAGAADIVFTVETGGTDHEVQRRTDLLTRFVQYIEDEHPAPHSVRYSVIAYRDHSDTRLRPAHVLDIGDLGPAADCQDFVRHLRATPVVFTHSAPIECALSRAYESPWRSGAVTRIVIVVGSRPPHPTADGISLKCPSGFSWRVWAETLRENKVLLSAVWDEPKWVRRKNPDKRGAKALSTWRNLGAVPPYDISSWSGEALVRRLTLLDPAPPARPLVLPITGGAR